MNVEWKYRLNSSLGVLDLRHAPIGWEVAENVLVRQERYDGVFNNYSLSKLGFFGESRIYLTQLFENEGIGLVCTVDVLHFNFDTQMYDVVYTGILNGRTYSEKDKDGGVIEMNIGESSLNEKLIARDTNLVSYDDDLSINGTPLTIPEKKYYDTVVQGMEIITEAKGEFEVGLFAAPANDSVKIFSIVNQGNNENIKSTQFLGVDLFEDIPTIGNDGWVYETFGRTSNVRIRIKGKFSKGGLDDGVYITIGTAKKLINPIIDPNDIEPPVFLENEQFQSKHLVYNQTYNPTLGLWVQNIDIDEEFTLDSYSVVMISFIPKIYFDNPTFEDYTASIYVLEPSPTLTVNVSEIVLSKTIKAIKPLDLIRRTVESITDEIGVLDSPILENIPDSGEVDFRNMMNFNGYMARGFDTLESRYATSLRDVITSYNIFCNCGFGTDKGRVIFDKLDSFYSEEVVLKITDIEKETWDRTIDPKLYTSEIIVGYEKTEYEENSGLEEYNNKNNYTTPIPNISTKASLLPKIRGDGYGITFSIEENIQDTSTNDTQYDKENFMMDSKLVNELYLQKGRDGFDVVNGIDQISTPINLNFTPGRILKRNSEKISVGFEKYLDQYVRFTKSTAPTDLVTRRTDEEFEVVENDPIETFVFKTQRFSGFVAKFEWGITLEMFYALQQNKYGKIEVTNPINGIIRYYWIRKVTHTSKTNIAKFELIEQYNGTSEDVDIVMADHNQDYVVTDNNERITVNG